MSRQISLDLALKTLSKAKFITPSSPDSAAGSFKLAENGLAIHQRLVDNLLQGQKTFDVTRKGRLKVKAARDRTFVLKAAVENSPPPPSAAFDFRVCETEGISVINPEPTIDTITVLKDSGDSNKWTFSYQDLLRTRRNFWKRLMFDPATLHLAEKEARSETPSASFEASSQKSFGLPNDKTLQMESVKVLDKDETDEFLGGESGDERVRMVVSKSKAMSGTLAVLFDSVRGRLFASKSAPPRLALANPVVPHHVALCAVSKNDPDVLDFRRYLASLLRQQANLRVWNAMDDVLEEEQANGDEFFNEYDACDSQGVPYLVMITPQSLKDGIVNVRDRETTWFEQVHASHLAQKFAHCFASSSPEPAAAAAGGEKTRQT